MIYTVQAANYSHEFSTEHGTFHVYNLTLFDPSTQGIVQAYISQKPTTAQPQVGAQMDLLIDRDPKGNLKAKKNPQATTPPAPAPTPAARPQTASQAPSSPSFEDTKQIMIIRQNALTNAVQYCIAKSSKDESYDLSGKHVVEVASYFAKFSEGKVNLSMSPEDVAREFGYTERDEDS